MHLRLPALLNRWLGEERGALTVLLVVLMPALLFAAALAIDISDINAHRRYVQAQADLAALSAARHLQTAASARGAARATAQANDQFLSHSLDDSQIVFGRFSGGRFVPLDDQTTTAGADAVRVEVRAPVSMYLLHLFMDPTGLVIARSAVAAIDAPRISFALSNCLATLNLLRPILQPLIPVGLDVLCSGRGVDAEIALFPELTDIATRMSLLTPSGQPLTYGDVLNAELPVSVVLETLLGRPVPFDPTPIRLGDVIVLGGNLDQVHVGALLPSARLQMADLILATAELLARRVLDLGIDLNLGPVGIVRAALAVGDPRQIVVGVRPGDANAVARTAQIELGLSEIGIAGIFTLRLRLSLANASARLSGGAANCAARPDEEVAIFDPVDANLIEIELQTRVLGLPGGHEALGIAVNTVEHRQTRRVAFTGADYARNPTVVLAPTGQFTSDNLASTLRQGVSGMLSQSQQAIQAARNAPSCSGLLGCVVGGLTATVRNLLGSVAGTLISTVANVANVLGAEGTLTNAILSGIVGLDLARAELTLLELGCGRSGARLVL